MPTATMKEKKHDRHKIPRVNFQVPKPFADLARQIAAQNRQPTTWLLLQLIATAAEEKGLDRPPLPWEEDQD